MNAHYDETPIENQKWQFKYGLKKEFIDLLFTEKLTLEQCRRLDVLHHGTEGQIRGLPKIRLLFQEILKFQNKQ